MKRFKNIPWHTLLLPLFFVFHGYADHYGFISIIDAASLAFNYILMAICILLLSLILFKNLNKAALMTTAWMSVYLSFGALFDFLKANSPVPLFFQYRFLGPFLIISLLVLFFFLIKSRRSLSKSTRFLNLLFSIFLLLELFQ